MNKEYDKHGILILKNNSLYNYFERKNRDLSARIKSIVINLKTSNSLTMNVKRELRSRRVATVIKNWNYNKKNESGEKINVGLLCDFLYSKDPIIENSYSKSKKSKMIEVVNQILPNIPFSTSVILDNLNKIE